MSEPVEKYFKDVTSKTSRSMYFEEPSSSIWYKSIKLEKSVNGVVIGTYPNWVVALTAGNMQAHFILNELERWQVTERAINASGRMAFLRKSGTITSGIPYKVGQLADSSHFGLAIKLNIEIDNHELFYRGFINNSKISERHYFDFLEGPIHSVLNSNLNITFSELGVDLTRFKSLPDFELSKMIKQSISDDLRRNNIILIDVSVASRKY